jgi:hypothetical protein
MRLYCCHFSVISKKEIDSHYIRQITSLLLSSSNLLALPASTTPPVIEYGLSQISPLVIRTMTGKKESTKSTPEFSEFGAGIFFKF